MESIDLRRLAAGLLAPMQQAGRRIMEHRAIGAAAERKADASPVTAADREAEAILLDALARVAPEVPVIAEEAAEARGIAEPGRIFFLVDPLDGTKEFISGHTDFTVNVALVCDGTPYFGMVYAPALAALYFTPHKSEAARADLDPFAAEVPTLERLDAASVHTRAPPAEGLVVVVSRSHLDPDTMHFLAGYKVADKVSAGSSLKFCRLAEGAADLYPRLSRTMEWDTAAGDAILRAAGGVVLDPGGTPLAYGKMDHGFANPGFVAWGRVPNGGH